MNKQELIERYKTKYAEEPKDWKHPSVNASRQDLFANFIRDLEQLEEPQKSVVPKFVADWIELCKEKADLISCLSGSYEYGVNQYKRITEDEDWLFEADHQELVARAWIDGYEVEKEPLYYVRLPYEVWDEEAAELKTKYLYLHYEITSDETRIFHTKEPRKGFVAKFDELTIKSANENYWPFAVPVEAE
ncbi:TPA: DUF1642 domain-containing protein [Enterococcus faecium]